MNGATPRFPLAYAAGAAACALVAVLSATFVAPYACIPGIVCAAHLSVRAAVEWRFYARHRKVTP